MSAAGKKTGDVGAGRSRRRAARLLSGTVLAAACVVAGLTAAPALAVPGLGAAHARPGSGYHVSPVTQVSTCEGYNAEVEQAVGKPHYVYEAWIGCGGEGFARSTDGGLHFGKPITLPIQAAPTTRPPRSRRTGPCTCRTCVTTPCKTGGSPTSADVSSG